MEDYDVFERVNNNKIAILFFEDDEKFIINKLLNLSDYEIIPIRFSYDLSMFSLFYTFCTKEWITLYIDIKNKQKELIVRKFIKHYIINLKYAYFPINKKYDEFEQILKKLDICVYRNKNKLFNNLSKLI
ncbi:MAG: hypothetical protein RSE41_07885 [Clostridia bacterium]